MGMNRPVNPGRGTAGRFHAMMNQRENSRAAHKPAEERHSLTAVHNTEIRGEKMDLSRNKTPDEMAVLRQRWRGHQNPAAGQQRAATKLKTKTGGHESEQSWDQEKLQRKKRGAQQRCKFFIVIQTRLQPIHRDHHHPSHIWLLETKISS
jgi:hypothetical protein